MRHLMISASSSCFTACPGCYNHFSGTSMPTEDLLAFCAKLQSKLGLERVTVAGGDPLARPDILTLLDGLNALGLRVILDTVGLPLLGAASLRFKGAGDIAALSAEELAQRAALIGIPLDGSTDDVLTQFRRFTTVSQQLRIIGKLLEAGAALCVNTVVHKGNVDDLDAIAALLSPYPYLQEWQLFQFMPSGPLGYRHRDDFEISEVAFHRATQNLHTLLPQIKVTARSNSARKHRYMLLDGSGMLWQPQQTSGQMWDQASASPERHLLGHMHDDRLLETLGAALQKKAPLPTRDEALSIA